MRKMTINNNLPKNLPLLLRDRAINCPENKLQAAKNADGKFEYFTYAEVYEKVLHFAQGLKMIGVKREDNIGLISDNRKEWLIADMAIQSLGAADVPRGCDSTGNEIRFIINFSDSKTAFFENTKQLKKVLENPEETPLLTKAILFDSIPEAEISDIKDLNRLHKLEIHTFDELMEKGKSIYMENPLLYKDEIESEMELTQPDDVATVIFTSGTTGTPKGVMLTHRNYISQLSSVHNFMPGKPNSWWMTILPVWHSFERLAQYVTILLKCGLAYSKPVARTLLGDMLEIQPRWMCGVPRLWEALATGVNKTMKKKGGITYAIYNFFMKTGKAYTFARDNVIGNICRVKKQNKFIKALTWLLPFMALWPVYQLGKVLVYNKIKAKFGGKFTFAISGGGALQKETDDFYRTIGLVMLDGYGMTETGPAIAFRDYIHPQNDCIGKVFPTVQCKIVAEEHGEINPEKQLEPGQQGMVLIRGDHVMKGYYKRPDLTAKIIDRNGWLNTGDIGMLTYDNDLKITGRAKDTIVLLDGENIEPVMLENALCSSEFIESAIVLGQDKKYLASLIVPVKEAIENYAKQHNIAYGDYESLLKTDKIRSLITSQINIKLSLEKGFRLCEKIAKFELLSESFKVGTELSAKQEMMRYKICEKYAGLIATLF